MKTNLSLKAKITFVVLPLLVGVITLSAIQVWVARARWIEAKGLVGAGQYVQATSALIHTAQVERGKSNLYLGKKITRAELDERRKLTDAALERAVFAAMREGVPFGQVTEGLASARRIVDADGHPPEMLSAYSSAILNLITSQAVRTTRNHVDGLESRLLSLTIFERGKESLGRLRATLSATLAQNKPVMAADVSSMESNRTGALSSFESPGLLISDETRRAMTDVLHSPQWNAVQSAYGKVVHRYSTGGYEEDASATFSNLSWVIDEVYKLINLESKAVGTEIDAVESHEKQLFWFVIVTCLLGTGLVSFLAWRVIQQLSASLATVAETLGSGATRVTSATRDISDMASKLSTSTTEQAAALQETVTSIDEVSAMVSKNAENAKRSQEVSVASTEGARKGKEAVSEMIVSIKEIAQANAAIVHQVETSNKELSEIVRIISEIGSKTKVINDIVFQTKLLSFNASVEAARAGEHGKGFAVVAEEVGNLAQMSGAAAKEISGMLDKSIQTVEQIVKGTKSNVERLVQAGKEKIDGSTVTANRCGEALDEMTRHVTEVSRMVTEIATASSEQAQGVGEINKAMSQLDEVTQQNSSATQAAATAAEELTSQASSFTGMVRTLKGIITGHEDEDAGGPSAPSSRAKVLKFPQQKKKRNPAEGVIPFKKAAGAEGVPSASDPRFEEF